LRTTVSSALSTQHSALSFRLCRFDPAFAALVVSWVPDAGDLFKLTPTTPPPLTAEKVIGWTRAGGNPLVLVRGDSAIPCAYAELNPMRTNEEHLWIGHVVVDPAMRGQGIGRTFVRKLVECGFQTLGAERISLIVLPGNEPAIRCYQAAGFELRAEEYHRFGAARRRCRMLRFELDRPRPAGSPPPVSGQHLRSIAQSLRAPQF